MHSDIDLDALLGEHVLDGVDQVELPGEYELCTSVRFRLDGVTYVATEDPEDGYRSCLQTLVTYDEPPKNTFAPCRVVGRKRSPSEYQVNNTVELVDVVTGKVVLAIGTDNTDDYYPWFVGEFNPQNMAANQGVTL